MVAFICLIGCIIACSLSIKKANSVHRKAQAILEDIETHQKLLIAIAAKENRRSKWRKI